MLTPAEHAQLNALYPEVYPTLRALATAIGMGHVGVRRILEAPAEDLRVHPRTEFIIRRFLEGGPPKTRAGSGGRGANRSP